MRTTRLPPIIGAPTNHVTRLRIADNHGDTNNGCPPMKPRGAGHIGRGGSTRFHDDAYCGAKVEYRTSSTPAYTDGLDLHYSTNNAPTGKLRRMPRQVPEALTATMQQPQRQQAKTARFSTCRKPSLRTADNHSLTQYWCVPTNHVTRLRIADNTRNTNYGCLPTDSVSWPDSALRTTRRSRIIGAYPRIPCPDSTRIADNQTTAHYWCPPTNRVTRLRIADNHSPTHHWHTPTNSARE